MRVSFISRILARMRMGNYSRRARLVYLILGVTCVMYLCVFLLHDPTSLLPRDNSLIQEDYVVAPNANSDSSGESAVVETRSKNKGNIVHVQSLPDNREESQSKRRIGIETSEDFQVTPDSWVTEWKRFMSNAPSSRPMRIYLPDGLQWWGLGDGKLECNTRGLDCEWDLRRGDQLDGIVNVRDFAHTSNADYSELNATHIYFALESPYAAMFAVNLSPKREFLASYWRGSDLWTPYYRWEYYDSQVRFRPPDKNYAEGRTKKVAIVVSNCQSRNRRLDYVRELQKYISVDVFGRCGTMDCRSVDCFDIIKKEYKFYLSFENSNCRDYITEKLSHNALENQVLPIVMGAHRSDYRAIVPQKSYLHVEDFAGPKELAEYLNLLDSDDSLYNQYFQWIGTGNWVSQKALCEVCAYVHLTRSGNMKKVTRKKLPYLNTQDAYSESRFVYRSSNPLLCLPQDKWYWERDG